MPSRGRVLAAVLIPALTLAAPLARAQDEAWPSRRVNVIVGYAAGGFADGVARIMTRKLSEATKQMFVVQNMAGAGGNIAARAVSVAAPDGYTLLATTTSLAINDTLYRDKGFSTDGLVAAAIPVDAPELLVASPKSGVKTLADLTSGAYKGQIFMGSSGIGSGSHISAEYALRILGKADVKHIPFPGGNPAMLALMTGDVTIVASTSTAIASIKNGEAIGLAVGSLRRSPLLPEVPTYDEGGMKDFVASSWTGYFAPKGVPDATLRAINAQVNAALDDPDVLGQLQLMGLAPTKRSLPETADYFRQEIRRWEQMVKAIGLQG